MKAAVLGSPISHSLSPTLHRAAYKQLGLEHTYDSFEVTTESFKNFISQLDSTWLGVSLTMPLKEVAFEVADIVSETARKSGSINTLVFKEEILADNTDVIGISLALREGNCSSPKSATIVGAGATARSAIVALAGLGIEEVVVLARNSVKSATCIDLGNELGISLDAVSLTSDILFSTDVVINTTPKGVADEFINHLGLAQGVLLDVVYDPWPTELAAYWASKGLATIPGYNMLLHQAVRQVELMTGLLPDVETMRQALLSELALRGSI